MYFLKMTGLLLGLLFMTATTVKAQKKVTFAKYEVGEDLEGGTPEIWSP